MVNKKTKEKIIKKEVNPHEVLSKKIELAVIKALIDGLKPSDIIGELDCQKMGLFIGSQGVVLQKDNI
jgi:hypothetical protein